MEFKVGGKVIVEIYFDGGNVLALSNGECTCKKAEIIVNTEMTEELINWLLNDEKNEKYNVGLKNGNLLTIYRPKINFVKVEKYY